MKRIAFVLCAALAIAMSASCSKEIAQEPEVVVPEGMIPVTFSIRADQVTKADLNGLSVEWKVGDEIAVYDGIAAAPNKFVVGAADGANATISGNVSEGTTDIYAVSPYSAARACGVCDTLNFAVSQPQVIPEGQCVAPEALVQVAKGTLGSDINFKNVVSLIKFTISSSDIKSVLIVSNSKEPFLGSATALFDASGNVTVSGATTSRMKVSPAEGTFAPGAYYVPVLPSSAATGIAFSTNSEAAKYIKQTSKEVTFEMKKGLNFGDLVSGEQVVVAPMVISSKADLDNWAANTRYYLKDETVTLANDIDYGGDEWTPVVNYYGCLDGKEHSIYNIKITASAHKDLDHIGLFYNLSNDNTIENLTLGAVSGVYDGKSSITLDRSGVDVYCGTLVGLLKNSTGTKKIVISNVKNYIPLTVKKTVVEKTGTSVGGVVGRVGLKTVFEVSSCKNYGAITNASAVSLGAQYYGGIMGASGDDDDGSIITNCENHALIKLSSSSSSQLTSSTFGAGIVGRVAPVGKLVISKCTNNGAVKVEHNVKGAAVYLGGIVGFDNTARVSESYNVTIDGCTNNGEIYAGPESKSVYMGGIIGCGRSKLKVSNCTNTGNLRKGANHNTQSAYGGIIGWFEGSATAAGSIIESCTVTGSLIEKSHDNTAAVKHAFGGIAGICNIDVKDCSFSGNITTTNTASAALHCAGGIAGYCSVAAKTDMKPTISGCTVNSTISTALTFTGGLVGLLDNANASFLGNNVTAALTSATDETAAYCGIVVGKNDAAATYGSAAQPIVVSGSFNGDTLDDTNYVDYLYGSVSTTVPTIVANIAE